MLFQGLRKSFYLLICLVSIVSTFVVQATPGEELWKQMERDFHHAYPNLRFESIKNKPVTLLIGNTGAGKSTISLLLEGQTLVRSNVDELTSTTQSSSGVVAGSGGQSVTDLPCAFNVEGGDSTFFDTPGLRDTRGPEKAILLAAFVKYILENASTVRIAFITSTAELIGGRGESFKKFMSGVKGLLPQGFDIYAMSSLIVTMVPPRQDIIYVKGQLEKYYSTSLAEGTEEVRRWGDRISFMSKPDRNGNVDHSQRTQILETILRATPRSLRNQEINLSRLYSTEDSLHLYSAFKYKLQAMANALLTATKTAAVDLNGLGIPVLEEKVLLLQELELEEPFRNKVAADPLLSIMRYLSQDQFEEASTDVFSLLTQQVTLRVADVGIQIENIKAREAEALRIEADRQAGLAQTQAQEAQARATTAEQNRIAAEHETLQARTQVTVLQNQIEIEQRLRSEAEQARRREEAAIYDAERKLHEAQLATVRAEAKVEVANKERQLLEQHQRDLMKIQEQRDIEMKEQMLYLRAQAADSNRRAAEAASHGGGGGCTLL